MDTTAIHDGSAEQEVRLIAHLHEEEQTLTILLVAVQEIREALLTRDGERLTQALQSEAESFQRGAAMRDKRSQLRQEFAERLRIDPAEVTLSVLENCVSAETRDELISRRQRLQEMSAEMLRLNRQNAAMTQQTLDLTERIVGRLTGSGPHFASYDATGHSEPAHVGPVLQWGG